MKIAIISGAIPPAHCGVGDYTDVLCENLCSQGIEVHVITDKKYQGNGIESYQIHPIVNRWFGIKFFKNILRELRLIDCHLVHIQYPTISYKGFVEINLLPLFLRLHGYKLIYTIHEYSDRPMLSRIRRWPSILGSHKVIMVENRFKKDVLKHSWLASEKKIDVINIGANIPKSNISEVERNKLRNELLGNYNGLVASYFGFINPNKEFALIIEAMNLLKNKNDLFFKLLVVGSLSPEDDYQSRLLSLISEYNLQEYILITGYKAKEEVGKYISCGDFAISLFDKGVSVRNGSFLALYQEGLTVVTTRPNNDFPDWPNIVYINEKSPNSLTNVLIKMRNRKKTSTLANCVNWADIAEQHINLYKKLSE